MKWEEEAYTRKDEAGNLVSLEEYDAQQAGKSWITWGDIKLYLICGVGFFIDSYDLFIINLVAPIWTYEYFGGHPAMNGAKASSGHFPAFLQGAVKAAANIGNIFGQLAFGFLGDAFGRKFVYGKEMIIAIIGIILTISVPNSFHNGFSTAWWFFGFRILMGIGIGGDYPMSAAIVAERSTLKNRGRMLALIFSNQGWGNLAGSIVTLILLGIFSDSLKGGNYGKLDGVWRLQIGLALVPAFATLYFRLTMPNSRKFEQSNELTAVKNSSAVTSTSTVDSVYAEKHAGLVSDKEMAGMSTDERKASIVEAHAVNPSAGVRSRACFAYFSEWRHLKKLIGTAVCWFLVDISFYGINLNQTVILTDIGFTTGSDQYHKFLRGAYGTLIIAVAGYVPGYFITVALIEVLGRKWIQIQGFLFTALMFGILAGDYNSLGTASKFALFTIAQLFFNFGPNATTFIIPAECFPSRVRGFAHGFSAACGKFGAILASLLFNYLSGKTVIGLANVLWIFFALNLLGAVVTVFFVPETKGIDADVQDYEEVKGRIHA